MRRAIVVIGGSAGAIEALTPVVASLPEDLEAAVFVVIHFPTHAVSTLPAILARAGPLPAVHAEHREPFRDGVIYVARPDHHLLVDSTEVVVARGPREHGHRPAIDPLFRSAARAHGPSVIAVLLSGNLDDGSAGLVAVRRRGGIAVVQDPLDARTPGMPASALEFAGADHVVPHAEIGPLIQRLVREVKEVDMADPSEGDIDVETAIAELDPAALAPDQRPGVPSGYSCPECHGALFEIEEQGLIRYRCRVGHAFASETLLSEQADAVETALWSALKALKERAALSRKLAGRMRTRGNNRSAESFETQAVDADRMAESLAEVLRSGAYLGGAERRSAPAAD